MWYVIQVGGGKEKSAHRLIERFVPERLMKELFIPQYEIMKRYEGEWRTCTETLLPGYLFVVTNQPEKLAVALRDVPAFTRLLGNNDMFTPLTDQEVAFVNAFTESGKRVVRMSEGVIEGDEIVILKGPLMHQTGLIKKVDRHKRLAYLDIQILGRTKTIKVGLEIVRKRP